MPGAPKDHYVPQCYLNNFAIEGADAKAPHIWIYNQEKIIPARVSDVAGEKHFYTFKEKDTGKPNRQIDDFFTKIETDAAPVLKKIIDEKHLKLTDQELVYLAMFFAVLAVRTPGAAKGQELMQEEAMKELSALETANPDALRKRYEEAGVVLNDNEWIEQLEFIRKKKYSIKFGEASRIKFIAQGLSAADEIARWYYEKKYWHLLINDTPTVFITSDHPMSVFRPVWVPRAMNAGYGNGTILITISPKLAILLRDAPLKKPVFRLSENKVIEINKNIMRFSNDYIFSNLKSKSILARYKLVGNKHFQKTKTTRHKFAPYVFFQTDPVPEELFS